VEPAPQPKATEPTANPSGPTLITVQCKPACIVMIDGLRIGVSPVVDRRISAGPHKVVGYRDDVGARVKDVTVEPGQHLLVEIAMYGR
jgi:hypothetical protein